MDFPHTAWLSPAVRGVVQVHMIIAPHAAALLKNIKIIIKDLTNVCLNKASRNLHTCAEGLLKWMHFLNGPLWKPRRACWQLFYLFIYFLNAAISRSQVNYFMISTEQAVFWRKHVLLSRQNESICVTDQCITL